MACWSAENATKAFLSTLKMGKRGKEPDVAEFVSALAAGNGAQLMVDVCSGSAGATTLALVAAAQQTGGRVVCILQGLDELRSSENLLGPDAHNIGFVVGDAQTLLAEYCKGADFVLVDCNHNNHEGVFQAVHRGSNDSGAVIVGYNAFSKGSWWRSGSKTQLLPIGNGLLVSRISAAKDVVAVDPKRRHWVVRIDQCTGEEHLFMIRPRQRKVTAS